MAKRRKHSFRKRRQTTFMLLLLIIIMIMIGPFLWRLEQLKRAKSVYDVSKVSEELQWLKLHGGLLNKLGLINDDLLWLDLNVGSKNLESELTMYQDEQHRFWLFLSYLRDENMAEAQNVLDSIGKTPLGQLGQALVSLSKGEAEESRRQLAETEADWKKLSKSDQTLRHLTLAQAAMITGDQLSMQAELEAAQSIEPNNPACLSVAFDIALGQGQWAKARELSQAIVAQTWRPKTVLFETKRAILAIHENDEQELSDCLVSLKELPRGENCINYVNGIHALSKGQQQEGKTLLQRALNSGLDGQLKTDAQRALDQVTERQKADHVLRSLGDGNVD